MTTISFDKNIHLDKNHFTDLDDFMEYIQTIVLEKELSIEHKKRIDERLTIANSEKAIFHDLEEGLKKITRKNV